MAKEKTERRLTARDKLTGVLQLARWHARAGDTMQAESCYRQVLACDPDNISVLRQLAFLLQSTPDRMTEALALLDKALSLDPRNAAVHTSRAVLLKQLNRELDALDAFAAAVAAGPDNPHAVYNLGLHLADLCCPAQAEIHARYLLDLAPDWPAARYLLVRALTALDADPAALDTRYRELVKSDPLNLPLRFAHGLFQLKQGDFAAGWDAQEWRWEIEPVKSSRLDLPQARWGGGPLDGRTLLVTGEQGFGDILQFARYLPLLVERAGKVVLQLDDNRAALARLLSCIDGLEIVTGRNRLPAFDLHCPLASLPYVFGTLPESIPVAACLRPARKDVDAWRARLAHLPRPWIGVCWAGSPEHSHDVRRSLPLAPTTRFYGQRQERENRIVAAAALAGAALRQGRLHAAAVRDAAPAFYSMEPLLRDTAGSFVSLQVGARAQDIGELGADLRARISAPLDAEADFYDTACLVGALDQVVTVDTSVAHVAGAVGTPGIVIVPEAPEWRWIERNGKSLWYPHLQLMRQAALAAIPLAAAERAA